MIGWEDVYNVLSAIFPLYVALLLGYGSVKWWHMFNPDHCDAINQLNYYFIMPLFSFDFTSRINPYKMNYLFVAADVISKTLILFTISLWANCSIKGNYPWSVTSFSLSSLNNSLIVGVPLMRAMYASSGENLVILSSILQSLLWNMCLLFMLELYRAKKQLDLATASTKSATDVENDGDGDTSGTTSVFILLKIVGIKLAKNPNSYGWNLKMPTIIEGSILIMSKAGSGVAMFCMGLFMALQEKIIGCGLMPTVFGIVLRFVVAPAAMAVGSFAVGLRGDVLHIAIIQTSYMADRHPSSVLSRVNNYELDR
ncbi:Auxin efflux carrier, partial [Cynara cardunculus var. scolymus]